MGLFGKKKGKQALPVLRFESGEAFIDYHCKYMTTKLVPGSPLAAIVLDAQKEFGGPESVMSREDGVQTAMLRVASDDGGFVTMAMTASPDGDRLQPGDVVAWMPSPERSAKLANLTGDYRSGCIGLIVAKIASEIDENTQQMTVVSSY